MKVFSGMLHHGVLLALLLGVTSWASAENDHQPEWVSIGTAHFKNGVDIPMYGVTVEDPVEDGKVLRDFVDCKRANPICDFDFEIPTAQQNALKLVQVPEAGVMLVPREWRVARTALGTDGSQAVEFYAKADHRAPASAAFAFYDTSACQGCALSAAARYFDNAVRLAKENDFSVDKRPADLKVVKVNTKKALFRQTIDADTEMNGWAWFDPTADLPFHEVRVTLPVSERSLATTLLNFGVR